MNNSGNSGRYSNFITFLVVVAFMVYSILRSLDYNTVQNYGAMIQTFALAGIAMAVTILLIGVFQNVPSLISLLAPLSTLIFFTAGSISINDFRYYFLVCFIINTWVSTYIQPRSMLRYIILSNGVFLALVLTGTITRDTKVFAGLHNVFMEWFFVFLGSIFIYMITIVAHDRNSASVKANNSFAILMTATPNMIALVDEMHRINYISKPMADFARIPDRSLPEGMPLLDLFGDGDMQMLIGELLDKDGFFEGVQEVYHNGSIRRFKVMVSDLDDRAPGKLVELADITGAALVPSNS
jgi:hypothetical protein